MLGVILLALPIATEARLLADRADIQGNCGGYHNPGNQFSTDLGRESNNNAVETLSSEEEKYLLDAKVTNVRIYRQTSITEAIVQTFTNGVEKILTFLNN